MIIPVFVLYVKNVVVLSMKSDLVGKDWIESLRYLGSMILQSEQTYKKLMMFLVLGIVKINQ